MLIFARPLISVFGLMAAGVSLGSAAHAQFRLEDSASGQRAAFNAATAAPVKPDLNRNRMKPLSPLGGPQTGSPLYIQPAAPASSIESSGSAAPSLDPPRPGIGASAALAVASSDEDPNKPRQPLRPQSLTKAATPKP